MLTRPRSTEHGARRTGTENGTRSCSRRSASLGVVRLDQFRQPLGENFGGAVGLATQPERDRGALQIRIVSAPIRVRVAEERRVLDVERAPVGLLFVHRLQVELALALDPLRI